MDGTIQIGSIPCILLYPHLLLYKWRWCIAILFRCNCDFFTANNVHRMDACIKCETMLSWMFSQHTFDQTLWCAYYILITAECACGAMKRNHTFVFVKYVRNPLVLIRFPFLSFNSVAINRLRFSDLFFNNSTQAQIK